MAAQQQQSRSDARSLCVCGPSTQSRWNATSNGEHCLGSYTTPSACTAQQLDKPDGVPPLPWPLGQRSSAGEPSRFTLPTAPWTGFQGSDASLLFLRLDATLTQAASNGVSCLRSAQEALTSKEYVVTASVASSWSLLIEALTAWHSSFHEPALLLACRRCCRLLTSCTHTE